jgi:hypothetical protein
MRGSRFATWQEADEAGRFLRSGGDGGHRAIRCQRAAVTSGLTHGRF